jgi:hypothetical protein
MRISIVGTFSLMAFAASAATALADDVPAGWTKGADGSYTHTASAMRCPSEIAGYAFQSFSGPVEPNFEGVCTYAKGDENGLLRVRRYVEGVGETPLAIRNDDGLMHPSQVNGGKIVAAFRAGPGPVVNGTQTHQLVLTFATKGYLVDCIARHTTAAQPPMDFTSACMKLGGQ